MSIDYKTIQHKVWNFDHILKDISDFPQTQKTLLGCHYCDKTLARSFYRKMKKHVKSGRIMRCTIPKTRFSTILYFTCDKNYNFIFHGDRLCINTYCVFGLRNDRNYIYFDKCFKLNEFSWDLQKLDCLDTGKIFKVI